jgi:hypothetical protein
MRVVFTAMPISARRMDVWDRPTPMKLGIATVEAASPAVVIDVTALLEVKQYVIDGINPQ